MKRQILRRDPSPFEWVRTHLIFKSQICTHEIKEGGREDDLLAGEDGEGAMQTVTVEDKTSDVVVWGVHGQDTRPSWSCAAVTSQTLTWLAENGDVQNAVSAIIQFPMSR